MALSTQPIRFSGTAEHYDGSLAGMYVRVDRTGDGARFYEEYPEMEGYHIFKTLMDNQQGGLLFSGDEFWKEAPRLLCVEAVRDKAGGTTDDRLSRMIPASKFDVFLDKNLKPITPRLPGPKRMISAWTA
ncbi:MAG: hypothetical protein IPK79_09960 [Vampirovibrionales bacterium]|nr:hypothetical protein [Vampirovibrionales bacterium]